MRVSWSHLSPRSVSAVEETSGSRRLLAETRTHPPTHPAFPLYMYCARRLTLCLYWVCEGLLRTSGSQNVPCPDVPLKVPQVSLCECLPCVCAPSQLAVVQRTCLTSHQGSCAHVASSFTHQLSAWPGSRLGITGHRPTVHQRWYPLILCPAILVSPPSASNAAHAAYRVVLLPLVLQA